MIKVMILVNQGMGKIPKTKNNQMYQIQMEYLKKTMVKLMEMMVKLMEMMEKLKEKMEMTEKMK